MHEKLRNISHSNTEHVVRKYGMPEIDEEQRTRATQIMEYIESVTNMENLYAEKILIQI